MGTGDNEQRYKPYLMMNDNTITQISCGYSHTLMLKQNGSLFGFGRNDFGQLGIGNNEHQNKPILILKDIQISQIHCGSNHSIFLKQNGNVYSFGRNEYGQLGVGDLKIRNKPTLIDETKQNKIKMICCGGFNIVLLSEKGNIFTFGNNYSGQLANGNEEIKNENKPVSVVCDKSIQSIGCGSSNTFYLMNDGSLYGCGENVYGQLANKTSEEKLFIYKPILIFKNENIKSISFGSHHTMIHLNDGNVFVWGNNKHGQLGLGDTHNRRKPTNMKCDKSIQILIGKDKIDSEIERVLKESFQFYLCVPLIEKRMN